LHRNITRFGNPLSQQCGNIPFDLACTFAALDDDFVKFAAPHYQYGKEDQETSSRKPRVIPPFRQFRFQDAAMMPLGWSVITPDLFDL